MNSLPRFHDFRVCLWRTVSMPATEMAAARAAVEGSHSDSAVVLSCQRMEAYGFGECGCEAPERLHGSDALARLAEVAAGLDSVVLGEDQIMGQVRSALRSAPPEVRSAGDIAVSAARRLRQETRFDSHAGHLLDRALRLSTVERKGSLLVLGVGSMGKLVAERATELGFDVTVAGRRKPAGELPWKFVHLGEAVELRKVDVLVGCLGSGAGEIALRFLPQARLVLDFGTPRNFREPAGPGLLTIADLLADEEARPHATARRNRLKARLGEIFDERLGHAAVDGSSAVGAMRREVERVRAAEASRIRALHPEIAPEVVENITRSLVDKILHEPTTRLRDDAELADRVAELFGAGSVAEPAD